jgi:hypothetical protein
MAGQGDASLSSPATRGSINRRSAVQAGLGIESNAIPRITKEKKDGCIAQMVEYLLSKCKALNSSPSTAKIKIKK